MHAPVRYTPDVEQIEPDEAETISLPRTLAMKVFDMPSGRLPGVERSAEDFVMVNGKTFQAKSTNKFLGNLKMLKKTTARMEGTRNSLFAVLRGARATLETVGLESAAVNSPGGAAASTLAYAASFTPKTDGGTTVSPTAFCCRRTEPRS